MSKLTPNLNLFCYDLQTDAKEVFSIEKAMNDNWEILDEKVVRKTGDTLTGHLFIHQPNASYIRLTNTSTDFTDISVPSSNISTGALFFADKNLQNCGSINNFKHTSGDWVTQMVTARSINGTTYSSVLGTRVNKTGKAWCFCTASDVAGSIVTTQAIAKSNNGYMLLGNGIQICWGVQGVLKSSTSITFPKAFASTPTAILMQPTYYTADNGQESTKFAAITGNYTSTGFVADGNYDCQCVYIAIGY